MMSRRDPLLLSDLELLREALVYRSKRVFLQGEAVRLHGLTERVLDLLLESAGGKRALRLSPPEQEVMARQVEAYCAELSGGMASPENRDEAARLRRIVGILAPNAPGAPGAAKRSWWRRWLGLR